MITSLSLANFKSWEQIDEMRLAPITGLFGANSSGKTSILQLLLLLKQTVESPDRAQVLQFGDEKSLVNLGSFPELIYDHDLEHLLKWALQWKLPHALEVIDPANPDIVLFSSDHMGFGASDRRRKTSYCQEDAVSPWREFFRDEHRPVGKCSDQIGHGIPDLLLIHIY